MFSTDPRHSRDARRLKQVSYCEAEALAALGAKVLHPRTIEPLRDRAIPLYVACTARPELAGTRISRAKVARGIKAVVARRDLALITMTRPSSWQPVGFMAEVAACFQRHGLSMDLIASSCSEIRATVDLSAFPSARAQLAQLTEDLARVCEPRIRLGMGSVSLVGSGLSPVDAGFPALSQALSKLEIGLFALSANGTHLSYVVREADVQELTIVAHRALLACEHMLPAAEPFAHPLLVSDAIRDEEAVA
jgi:diaminopimelate decarboxylase/aspartate kinase